MPNSKTRNWFAVLPILTISIITLTARGSNSGTVDGYSLLFDSNKFTLKTSSWGKQTITYRAYEGIVYVSKPVDASYQRMNFYVSAQYYQGKSIGTYNAETAPIFYPNRVGGYMSGDPGTPGLNRGNTPNSILMALSKGFVAAAPGARGRTLQDKSGHYIGKAPSCIVDLKAAVRYLRHNDKIMPGNAEKIISNGTSAGGALSALLGATGNSADFEPYLKAIGAATEGDNVFAASCYCPITDLDHSDAAYEWLFNGINNYNGWGGSHTMSPNQVNLSDQLKILFPSYLNSLGLRGLDGNTLALEANGEGSFKDYVKAFVIASAQTALKGGKDLSGLTWMTIKGGNVTDIDIGKFVTYATRMKAPPAFDSLDLASPETSLFGDTTINNKHFTPFSRENSTDHNLADADVVKMMNPMNYIGVKGTSTAQHWRIRHGAIDRDTSLAIPVIVTTKLQNNGFHVDFAMPWGQGHGGDYDLDDLFDWINQICR